MRYTPRQLRDAVGLSKEAFRHWKRVLPGVPHGKSHGPIFSPGDVLAFAVVRGLTDRCGIQVGQLWAVSRRIFDVCNETPWEVLAERIMVIDLGRQECATVRKTGPILRDSAAVVCLMEPVIVALRDDLLRTSPVAASRTRQEGAVPEGSPTAVGRHA